MQQTMEIGQLVQPSVSAQVAAAVENLKTWWREQSQTFTALCGTEGDTFTHGDVVKTVLGLAAFILILGVAGWLEGGAV